MSRNNSMTSSESMNQKRLVAHTASKIPVLVKSAVRRCVKKQNANGGKTSKATMDEIHLGARPVKISEPHQLASPESCPFVRPTGSKGDHIRENSKLENSGGNSDEKIHSLNFLVEPRFNQGDSFLQMHSSFPENSVQDESLDRKYKVKSSITIGDCVLPPINEDNIPPDIQMDNPELGGASKQKIKTAEIVRVRQDKTEIFESTVICEIFPQVLLLIPDMKRPGGYNTQLHIVNKSKCLLAYKVYLNETADMNYVILPMYGIIEALGSVLIEIETKRQDGNLPGGFSQKFTKKDRIEIKTIESIGVASKKELCQFWNIAEQRYPQLIKTTVIGTIKVLEPCNMSMLKAIDEGEERDFVQKALEDKYKEVFFPQMIKNREDHLIENEVGTIRNRIDKLWYCTVPTMSRWLNRVVCLLKYFTPLLIVIAFLLSFIHSTSDMVPNPSQNHKYQFHEMILRANRQIVKLIEGYFV